MKKVIVLLLMLGSIVISAEIKWQKEYAVAFIISFLLFVLIVLLLDLTILPFAFAIKCRFKCTECKILHIAFKFWADFLIILILLR